jgi:recombination protein RecR
MSFSPLIEQLIDALRCLPGVGPKSAQRMAMHILEHDRGRGAALADALAQAIEKVGQCDTCRTLTEQSRCDICSSPKRDERLLCVVEQPSDVMAVEQSGTYRGRYFVLMGHLSPIDGVGPEQLGIPELMALLGQGGIEELIIATNPTVEGEATAYFIAEQAKLYSVTVSRIAHGVPLGGDLDLVDMGTLAHAFKGRTQFS